MMHWKRVEEALPARGKRVLVMAHGVEEIGRLHQVDEDLVETRLLVQMKRRVWWYLEPSGQVVEQRQAGITHWLEWPALSQVRGDHWEERPSRAMVHSTCDYRKVECAPTGSTDINGVWRCRLHGG